MLDHVFTQLVASHRHAFEAALLQRQAVEERFQVDVFLGDVSFETSYSLPGEERPARIRVDTSLDWPTWSQTAYRSWAIGEEPDELPEVLEPLVRGPATIEHVLLDGPDDPECAIEVSYEGSCAIDEALMEDPSALDEALAPLGRDVASLLVRIADLPFTFRPVPDDG